MKTVAFAVSLPLIFGFSPAAPAPEEIKVDTDRPAAELRFEYIPGKTYRQKMVMNQASTINTGSTTIEQKVRMEMGATMTVSAIPDSGNTRIEATYDRISMNQQIGETKMSFDSDDDDGGDAAGNPLALIGGMVGKKFSMIVDGNSEIIEVEGIDEMISAMSGNNPAAAQMMKQFMNEKQFKQMINSQMQDMLPGKPVAPGDSWDITQKIDLPQMGSVSTAGTCELIGYADFNGHDCAVINLTSTIDMDLSGGEGDSETSAALAKMGMKVSGGKMNGKLFWDPALGHLRGSNLTQAMTITMKDPADGSDMTIPIEQKIDVSMEIE